MNLPYVCLRRERGKRCFGLDNRYRVTFCAAPNGRCGMVFFFFARLVSLAGSFMVKSGGGDESTGRITGKENIQLPTVAMAERRLSILLPALTVRLSALPTTYRSLHISASDPATCTTCLPAPPCVPCSRQEALSSSPLLLSSITIEHIHHLPVPLSFFQHSHSSSSSPPTRFSPLSLIPPPSLLPQPTRQQLHWLRVRSGPRGEERAREGKGICRYVTADGWMDGREGGVDPYLRTWLAGVCSVKKD